MGNSSIERVRTAKIREDMGDTSYHTRLRKTQNYTTTHYYRTRLAGSTLDMYKARLVAGAHGQKCEDYFISTSPAAKTTSIKPLFSIAAQTYMHTRNFDVKGTYLKTGTDE